MDASSVAAAALAVAVQDSRAAAIRELLLERERLAMAVADRDSYLAQRHFVGSLQVPRVPGPPMTWRAAYNQRHNDILDAHAAMRAARRAVLQGDARGAEDHLTAEVGSEDSEEDEEMEVEEVEEEAEEEGEEEAEEEDAPIAA